MKMGAADARIDICYCYLGSILHERTLFLELSASVPSARASVQSHLLENSSIVNVGEQRTVVRGGWNKPHYLSAKCVFWFKSPWLHDSAELF